MTEKQYDIYFVGGLMVVVAVIAWLLFSRQSLRLDESQSLFQTSRNLPTLFKLVAQDVHVPLHHVLLHFWQKLFSNNVSATRILSLIFFIATVPTVYATGKLAYNRQVASFGAILVAISPFLNWYGSETRMYSLLVFMTVLNQYFFVKLFTKNQGRFGYFISALFGIFTHYFFFLVLLTQAVFLFLFRKHLPKGLIKFYWSSMFGLAILFSPWLYLVAKSGFASSTQPQIGNPNSFTLFQTFTEFFFGFQSDHLDSILVSLWPISVILGIWAMHKRPQEREQTKLANSYFLMGGIFPVALVFLISLKFPIYLSRYLIFTIPALYLVLSWILTMFPKKLTTVCQVILVCIMSASLLAQGVSAATPVKENYEGAVHYIEARVQNQDVIILSAPFTIYPVSYYYTGNLALNTLPIWNRYQYGAIPPFSLNQLPTQVTELTQGHANAWLLLSYDQGYNNTIRLYFDTHYQRLDHQVFSPGLDLYEYKISYH